VVRKKCSRTQLLRFTSNLSTVKPYVKTNKNDYIVLPVTREPRFA